MIAAIPILKKSKGNKMSNKFDNVFAKTLDKINEIRESIKDLTFEQAAQKLGGYNYDEDLFDYDYDIDDSRCLVGTILNDNGKPYMPEYNNFYEVWETPSNCFATELFAMTEREIQEQVYRLK